MTLLLELAQERYQPERRVVVEDWQAWARAEMPKLTGWVGQHSFTTAGRRPLIYCDSHVSSSFGGREFPGMWEGELRRRYVDACAEGERSHWSRKDEAGLLEIAGLEIPHYFTGQIPDEPLVSLDLNHAWWAFARKFSTQVEYRVKSGAWGAVGNPWQDLDELMPHKQLRTVVCQRGWRVKRLHRWVHGEMRQAGNSDHFQPQAFRLLSDYLHAVAQEMVGLFGAVLVLSDEYALPADNVDEARAFLLERWGLTCKVAKTWEPGEVWPYHATEPQYAIRDQPNTKRQRLAWQLVGNGPRDGALVVSYGTSAGKGSEQIVGFEAEARTPAPKLAFHRDWYANPNEPLRCPRTGQVRHRDREGRRRQVRSEELGWHASSVGEGTEVMLWRAVDTLAERFKLGP